MDTSINTNINRNIPHRCLIENAETTEVSQDAAECVPGEEPGTDTGAGTEPGIEPEQEANINPIIPKTWSLGSMGITKSFSGKIEGVPDTETEMIIKNRVENIEFQAIQVAESYKHWDNISGQNYGDLNPMYGRVVLMHPDANDNVVSGILDYNVFTGKPVSLGINNKDGNSSNTLWDVDGNMISKLETRNLGTHQEHLKIIVDKENDVILYEEIVEAASLPADEGSDEADAGEGAGTEGEADAGGGAGEEQVE
jgi:hypothetical protein